MKPEEQRIAIAEACGWYADDRPGYWGNDQLQRITTTEQLPDYLNDLNAMHEAEKVLNEVQWCDYWSNLDDVCRCENTYHGICRATSPQRAEAFLRTIGKWKD